MKTLLIIALSLMLFHFTPTKAKVKESVSTCYGNNPCAACSNCSRCKHCGAGGSCGVCARGVSKTINSLFNSNQSKTNDAKATNYRGQCKAITKKGSRCKRNGTSSGYCWQHGKS